MIARDSVVHEVVLPAPPGEVFDMFVDPEKLVLWIGISADLDARRDGRLRFEVMPGQFCDGRYVVVDRPHRLVFTWEWSTKAKGGQAVTSEPATHNHGAPKREGDANG